MTRSTFAFAEETSGSFSELVNKSKGAVVYISTVRVISGRSFHHPFLGPSNPNDPFSEFFDRFFGEQAPKDYKQNGLGSGFVIDKEGHILTNNHVIEKSDEITVTLAGNKKYPARVVGRDPKTDLALIRIEADEPLEPLVLGNSDQLEVGDWVIAIGNPYGLGNTVTAGIVSYKSRDIGTGPYDDFIQTDAAINPGNSGGPLLNTRGEVIGINTAIFSQSGGSVGIGFAIPVNIAKGLLPQLMQGKVVRGWLGVMIQMITPELKQALKLKDEKGALVSSVTDGGPAQQAGIRTGDVIVSFDGKEIREWKDLPLIVGSTPVGKKVRVEALRNGKVKFFQVQVAKLKEEDVREEAAEPESNLGMVVEALTPQLARELDLVETSGVVVTQVESDSAAAEAGFRPGDLIIRMDETEIKTVSDYYNRIHSAKEGDIILFLIKRDGNTLFLTMKIKR